MATRGRKPKPTALKIAQGNPGKRALNRREPTPDASIPSCPDHLSSVARAEWERITAELAAVNMLTQLDRAALAIYCETYGIWVEATTHLKKTRRVLKTQNGIPIANPWHYIATTAAKDLAKISAEFGLTPSSRSRIEVETTEEIVDPLATFAAKRA